MTEENEPFSDKYELMEEVRDTCNGCKHIEKGANEYPCSFCSRINEEAQK